jgi:hypothetical protein
MFKTKLIEWGIPELSPIITLYDFQTIGMLIGQPQSQALKVFKQFILALQEENPLTTHRANLRGTDSVHMKQLSGLLHHHRVNWRIGCNDHLAMMTRSTNKVTLKLEQQQSSEKA